MQNLKFWAYVVLFGTPVALVEVILPLLPMGARMPLLVFGCLTATVVGLALIVGSATQRR